MAIGSMALLAVMRVVRVHFGQTPHPDGGFRWPFILAFVLLPPLALGLLTQSDGSSGPLRGLAWVPVYGALIVGLMLVMQFAAVVIRFVAPRPVRAPLVLALTASEGDPYAVPYDPPVTPALAATVAQVDRLNAAFPRGLAFRAEIERTTFRATWDALDTATRTLEGAIADAIREGRGAASSASATAHDARGRLDALRRMAVDDGQTWVTA